MKQLLIASLIVVGCGDPAEVAPDAATNEGPNLLRNSNFEEVDGSWVAEWENLGLNPNGKIVRVTSTHSGEGAVQWQMEESGREHWITQHNVPLQAGKRYALAGWYHVEGDGDIALNYIVSGVPGPEPHISTLSDAHIYPKVAGEWAEFRFELRLPAGPVPQSWDVALHSIRHNTKPAKLTLDDVRMFEIPAKGRAYDPEWNRGPE